MADVKFKFVLPIDGDSETARVEKLVLKGKLLHDPHQFSINFVNSATNTDDITYHFKVRVPTQTVIENYKSNGQWSSSHREKYLNIFEGNTNKIGIISSIVDGIEVTNNCSFTEASFALEFQFDYDSTTMVVYQIREDGHNFITQFESLYSLSEIKSVHIWGDVQKVKECSLTYE